MNNLPFDVSQIREDFPALGRLVNNQSIIYLDGPAGTQVPTSVIQAIAQYYQNSNANTHGYFTTTRETDQVMATTRALVAKFINAPKDSTISFGQNMTSLNFALSQALSRHFKPGDEIVISALDHESNRQPWIKLKQQGIIVKEIDLLPSGELDYSDAERKINEKTRLVAVGWASNITGTINQVEKLRLWSKQVGAYLLIDAVHYAAHFSIDVSSLDCDFLLCSAYKFYGPHVGILYCRPGLLDQLEPDRLRTQRQTGPYRIETGTQNHAAIAGVKAAIEYIAAMGTGDSTEVQCSSAFEQIAKHEYSLASKLHDGLLDMPNTNIFGPDFQQTYRSPTISFYHSGKSAQEICQSLADKQIQCWAGHFYAIRSLEVTNLLDGGGVVRMGISAYTSEKDIQSTLNALHEILS